MILHRRRLAGPRADLSLSRRLTPTSHPLRRAGSLQPGAFISGRVPQSSANELAKNPSLGVAQPRLRRPSLGVAQPRLRRRAIDQNSSNQEGPDAINSEYGI